MDDIQEHTYQLPQPLGEFDTITLRPNYNYETKAYIYHVGFWIEE
jgi:hypothetical protein